MATDNDVARLVRQIQAGRSPDAAFRKVYERFSAPVTHFFANRGFPRQEAEELTQDALFRVYRNIGKFRLEASFETWLFKIVKNVWKNALRDREAKKRSALELPLDAPAADADDAVTVYEPRAPGPDPLADALAGERTEILEAALAELPAKMREVALLRMQDYKYREIAELLQVSLTTVKSQLTHATQRLRPLLAPHFDVFFLDSW